MAHVFISYSHKERAYAHKLADEIKRRGIEVWIDDRINYGEQWPRVIQENLEHCGVLVVIMSPNAYNSRWVQNELVFAQELGKAVVPLLLEGRVWLSLASSQYVNVAGGKMPEESFYSTVKKHLRQEAAQHLTRVTQPPPQPAPDELWLGDRIFGYLQKAMRNQEGGNWEMGMFEVGYLRASREIPSYILNTNVINEHLLKRYDPDVHQDYKSNYDALLKKRSKVAERGPSDLGFGITESSSPLLNEMFHAYTLPLIELRQRLNLELGRAFMHDPTDAEIQQFAKELIQLHQMHNIPIGEIRVKVLS